MIPSELEGPWLLRGVVMMQKGKCWCICVHRLDTVQDFLGQINVETPHSPCLTDIPASWQIQADGWPKRGILKIH